MELFAYLIYKQGAYCTNGEIISVLWDGNANKQPYLRKLISDMRECFRNVGAEDLILKKYGAIGVNINILQITGDPQIIADEYRWI